MIEMENLTVSCGSSTILRGLSLTASPGTITVLLGQNGCGKTTLLRAVSGAIRYTGSIRADGREVRETSAAVRSRVLALMPQMLSLPAITVRELVSFGRQPYTGVTGILTHRDWEIVADVLWKTGLSELADRRLDRLSGGERQKAFFALLLAQETPNLLLDEPGAHLDASYTSRLMDFLREARAKGKTVLTVLHDINRALELADRIAVLHEGGLAFAGDVSAFCESSIPEKIFGLRQYLLTSREAPDTVKYCYL